MIDVQNQNASVSLYNKKWNRWGVVARVPTQVLFVPGDSHLSNQAANLLTFILGDIAPV